MSGPNGLVKRAFDVVVAGVLLLLTAPVLVAVSVVLLATLGSPVLFRQQRPGRNGIPFELVKFRTMKDTRGKDGHLLPNEERATAVGNLLRRTSLDELPELWNVVRGDMSLVGPRPLLTEYLEHYTDEQMRRHEVRPGITGWAQVHGRNTIPWEERFRLDVWYIDNWSFILDLRILLRTIAKVLRREEIAPDGSFTVQRFRGTSERPSNGTRS